MSAIQSKISRGVTLVISFYLLICGGLFLKYIHYKSFREFDLTLEAQMKAMVSLVELEGRKIDIDFFGDIMPEFMQKGQYFDFYLSDGTLIAQSPSSQKIPLPEVPQNGEKVHFLNWDSGVLGNLRVVQTSFEPRAELAEVSVGEIEPEGPDQQTYPVPLYEIEYDLPESVDAEGLVLTVRVARDRTPLEQEIRSMTLLFAGLAGILLMGIAVLTRLLVRHGLKNLRELNAQIKGIEPSEAKASIALADAPEELVEIERTVNALLQRVRATLAREKSFSTHVSHELRTPVAELKLIAEMGGNYPGDQKEVVRYFSEVKDISANMEMLVNRLLFLSRSAPGVTSGSLEKVGLNDLLDSCMTDKAFAEVDRSVDEVIQVMSDPELLKILFQNLLNNAISHRCPGTRVACQLKKCDAGVCVQIENAVADFSEVDLERISEPFWQKSTSRTCVGHYGLGLSIVQNIGMILSLEVRFSIKDGGRLFVEVLFPERKSIPEA